MVVNNQIIELEIDGLGSSGEGVGGFNGLRVFVDKALPGETVSARIQEIKRSYAIGTLIDITNKSSERIDPSCKFYDECGGCQIMHLDYSAQLKQKTLKVADAFRRIGGFTDLKVEECVPSQLPLGYRNKASFPVSGTTNKLEIGLYALGTHRVINIDTCPVQGHQGNQVYKVTRDILRRHALEPYNEKTGRGLLRHILIRAAESTGDSLVVIITSKPATDALKGIAEEIMNHDSSVKGVINCVNITRQNRILGQKFYPILGKNSIREKLLGLEFAVSAQSFFQINSLQAEKLYQAAIEAAALEETQIVLDAYCGVGTLSLMFARHVKKVIGIEVVPEAIIDARLNAKINTINNVEFICATTEGFVEKLPLVDVALVNPPRKGCEPEVLRSLAKKTKRILYISCNPATLARDAALLRELGFTPKLIQPFDMFPQTMHVETLVKFEKAGFGATI